MVPYEPARPLGGEPAPLGHLHPIGSRSPIPKVLSTMGSHGVEALLMGGQACVLYGAAEFSQDANFAVLASRENFDRLRHALDALQARVIAVPPVSAGSGRFEEDAARQGLADDS